MLCRVAGAYASKYERFVAVRGGVFCDAEGALIAGPPLAVLARVPTAGSRV